MAKIFEAVKIIANTQYNITNKAELERIKNYLFQNGFDVTMKEAETLWSEYSDIHSTGWLIVDSLKLYNFVEWLNNLLEDMRC